jgi:hypothetical protein
MRSAKILAIAALTVAAATPALAAPPAVPETHTWVMMLMGISAIGGILRIGRKRAAATA